MKTGPWSLSLQDLRQRSLGLFHILKLRKLPKKPVETGLFTGFNIKHIITNVSY